MIDAVIQRLASQISDLKKVEGAGAFAAIMEANAWPQQSPSAFVVPLSVRGGGVDAATNAYLQTVAETIAVVLILRPNDRLAARGIEPVEGLRDDVIQALAGWRPGDEVGVFEVSQARMLNVRSGRIAYQIQFTITDQLRILS